MQKTCTSHPRQQPYTEMAKPPRPPDYVANQEGQLQWLRGPLARRLGALPEGLQGCAGGQQTADASRPARAWRARVATECRGGDKLGQVPERGGLKSPRREPLGPGPLGQQALTSGVPGSGARRPSLRASTPSEGLNTYWPRRGPRASREGRSGARLASLLTPPGARGWAPQHRVRGAPAPPTPWTESTRGCKGAAGPSGPGPRAARTGRPAPR